MDGQVRLIRSAEARRMPWRNGGGETVEIAAHPPGAGLDAFDWRVSLARIDRDGPFSTFPGVDRAFAVLEGDGVELQVGAGPFVRLVRDSDPLAFPGEAPCRCRLLGGPVTALNAMASRGRLACTVARLDSGGLLAAGAAARIIVCSEGRIATRFGTAERHDAILVPAGASAVVDPGAYPAQGFVVTFEPVAEIRAP